MKNEMEPIVVTTTSDDRKQLMNLAHKSVEKNIAACAQIGASPVTSVYRWEGKVETAEEFVLTIKTSKHHFPAVEETICEHHNYEVPQIVAVPMSSVGVKYQKWLDEQLNG